MRQASSNIWAHSAGGSTLTWIRLDVELELLEIELRLLADVHHVPGVLDPHQGPLPVRGE